MKKEIDIEIHDPLEIRPDPDQYILELPLKKAVETALRFNQPLLLTGEPGTGKTQLAYKVAFELHRQTKDKDGPRFSEEPLRFNTKTTSQARDLFYTYDAIGHFQQANMRDMYLKAGQPLRDTADFIKLEALGAAIVNANPKKDYEKLFRYNYVAGKKPSSSVVLIDEVDKAPRDFTNDILNEIENKEFFVREQDNERIALGDDNQQRILLIMTSNSEKNLPEAFLRRCVFYHIPTPRGKELQKILMAHLHQEESPVLEKNLETLTEIYEGLRSKATRKPVATAEFVALVKLLEMDKVLLTEIEDPKAVFRENIMLLVKTKEDIEAVSKYLEL